jgi:photosystem II stability/assembly factor-like uncharacterized protein
MLIMRILVGTVGQSVLASDDGERWSRLGPNLGFHSDAIVRCLTNAPGRPEVLWAGTDRGILRSEDAGRSWCRLEAPFQNQQVWRISISPHDEQVVFAGTGTPSPACIFRSDDGGKTWQPLSVDIVEECPAVGVPRVTDIAVDPSDPRQLWASIEVDGMRRSVDGGQTWTRINGSITNPDGHAASVSSGQPKLVVLTVNNEIHVSRDGGATFESVGVREHFPYTHVRDVVFDAVDANTAWAAIGDATPGTTGVLMRTRDGARSWERVDMPVEPNSAMWVVRTQPDAPELVLAASRYGYLYRSDDHGETWRKLRREFSEVSSIAWVPD